jgi:hypothetical protein
MDNNQLKDNLIDFLNQIKVEIDAFEKELTDKQKRGTGSLKKWSAKDIISHLVFWGNHFNSQVIKAKNGEKVPQAGDYYDQVNDGVLIEHLNQPFTEALSDLYKSFKESMDIIKSFSADELNEQKKNEYLNDRTLIDHSLGALGWHVMHHISDFYAKNGQKKKAIAQQEEVTEKMRDFPTWKANANYNLACFFALNGEKERAIKSLKTAFVESPDLIEWSKSDSDLDALREDADFKALYPNN